MKKSVGFLFLLLILFFGLQAQPVKWTAHLIKHTMAEPQAHAVSDLFRKGNRTDLEPLSLVLISGYELKAGDNGITID
jgi:hypothetical protein